MSCVNVSLLLSTHCHCCADIYLSHIVIASYADAVETRSYPLQDMSPQPKGVNPPSQPQGAYPTHPKGVHHVQPSQPQPQEANPTQPQGAANPTQPQGACPTQPRKVKNNGLITTRVINFNFFLGDRSPSSHSTNRC